MHLILREESSFLAVPKSLLAVPDFDQFHVVRLAEIWRVTKVTRVWPAGVHFLEWHSGASNDTELRYVSSACSSFHGRLRLRFDPICWCVEGHGDEECPQTACHQPEAGERVCVKWFPRRKRQHMLIHLDTKNKQFWSNSCQSIWLIAIGGNYFSWKRRKSLYRGSINDWNRFHFKFIRCRVMKVVALSLHLWSGASPAAAAACFWKPIASTLLYMCSDSVPLLTDSADDAQPAARIPLK